MKTILLITLAFTTTIATARIGETPAECQKRYGEPVKVNKGDQSISYKKAGFFIHITFMDGKAAQLFVCKNEQDALGNFPKISEAEIDSLLKANKGSGEWVKA